MDSRVGIPSVEDGEGEDQVAIPLAAGGEEVKEVEARVVVVRGAVVKVAAVTLAVMTAIEAVAVVVAKDPETTMTMTAK